MRLPDNARTWLEVSLRLAGMRKLLAGVRQRYRALSVEALPACVTGPLYSERSTVPRRIPRRDGASVAEDLWAPSEVLTCRLSQGSTPDRMTTTCRVLTRLSMWLRPGHHRR